MTAETRIYLIFPLFFLVLAGCREYEAVEKAGPKGYPLLSTRYRRPLFFGDTLAVQRIEYHFNGSKKSITRLENGLPHGKCEAWWMNGIRRSSGEYVNGVREGLWQDYFEKNGTPSARGKYHLDKKEGAWEQLWPNGRLMASGLYSKGLKTGVWTESDSLGRLTARTSCWASSDTGSFTSYHPGGNEKKHHDCRWGKPVGRLTVWDVNGEVLESGIFDSIGKKTGIWETWYGRGRPASRCTFKAGLLVDTAVSWDSIGQLAASGVFTEGTGEMVRFFPGGGTAVRELFDSGRKHGIETEYFRDGTLKSETTYSLGERVLFRRMHPSAGSRPGAIAVEGGFRDGKRHGEWKWYSPGGVLIELCNFETGKKHGMARYFSPETGRLVRTQGFHRGVETMGTLAPGAQR